MVSRQQYYLDTGTDILTTGADITRFVIREMTKEGITQFRPREVTNRIKNIPNLNRDLCKKPFPRQPKPKHRFSAVFAPNCS